MVKPVRGAVGESIGVRVAEGVEGMVMDWPGEMGAWSVVNSILAGGWKKRVGRDIY